MAWIQVESGREGVEKREEFLFIGEWTARENSITKEK